MDSVIKEMTLGFYDEVGLYTVYAKQKDSGRKIRVKFVNEMKSYVLQDYTYLYFYETFANGMILNPILIDMPELSEDHSEVTIQLLDKMLLYPGIAKCELAIVKTDGPIDLSSLVQIPIGNIGADSANMYEPVEEDPSSVLSGNNAKVLTTAKFNLYIDTNVYTDGNINIDQSVLAEELAELVIGAQQLIDHDKQYTINEEERKENENRRQEYEHNRINQEHYRIANEGIGDASSHTDGKYNDEHGTEVSVLYYDTRRGLHERIVAEEGRGDYLDYDAELPYVDSDGQTKNIKYCDSRKGTMERMIALHDGGSYIDDDNETVISIHDDPDSPDLESMSYRALAEHMIDEIEDAEHYYNLAKSYAKGDTGLPERPNEDTDNAKYYMQMADTIARSVDGSLKMMGPCAFEDLPDPGHVGYMYQMTNDFVTDDRFVEGEGVEGIAGDQVYYTNKDKWAIFIGSQVRGVKGVNEDRYRIGQVELSAEDVGAIPVASSEAEDGQVLMFDMGEWVPSNLPDDNYLKYLIIGEVSEEMTSPDYYWLANGYKVCVTGRYAHAEGNGSQADGDASHAEGLGTIAGYEAQHVAGKYNKNEPDNLYEIGNGSSSSRHNAFEVDVNGFIQTGEGAKIKFGTDSSGKYGYYAPNGTFTRFGNADSVVLPINPSVTPTTPGAIWITT